MTYSHVKGVYGQAKPPWVDDVQLQCPEYDTVLYNCMHIATAIDFSAFKEFLTQLNRHPC